MQLSFSFFVLGPWSVLTMNFFVSLCSDPFIERLHFSVIGYLCREDQGQIEFAALDQLENPDLHMVSVPTMKLHNKIKHFIASLVCPKKFTLKDLIKPETDRTEIFLSAILNFGIHKYGNLLISLYCLLHLSSIKALFWIVQRFIQDKSVPWIAHFVSIRV